MKILGKLLLTLASLAYPLLWYYGRENGVFFWLAAAMCILWLIRAAMPQTTGQRITAIILAAFLRRYWFSDGLTRCIGIPSPSMR